MKDHWEIFLSVTPWLLWTILVIMLIMVAPSIDRIVWGQ
jgi:hypothetical protein